MMTVGGALRAALADGYQHSWRLVLLNTALSVVALSVLGAALFVPAAILLALLVGPAAAALMHCAVTLVETEDLRLGEAVEGLRLHWRRGLVLAALTGGVYGLGIYALVFYARAGGATWPLAVAVLYILGLFGVVQLLLWPLAVFERGRPLGSVLAEVLALFFRRPVASSALALVLFLVNAAGAAAAVLPFLTMTIAYSFLAAAHFTVPRKPMQEG